MTNFLKLAQEAYESSSAWVDTNYRPSWDYSIKAFNQEHAPGSKYTSGEFAGRSKLVSPKTRSIIRKNEAAAAMALFQNMDMVNLTPGNPTRRESVASTEVHKALLEYRLQNTIPTFEICIGGIQDAQTQGAVVSYQYWEYQIKNGVKVKDKPCIELRPIENIRLDGGASWIDPIETSPYLCDIIPMYVCDVRGMMNSKDGKTGQPKWKKFKDDVLLKARPDVMDTTRKARLNKQQDPHDEKPTDIKSFDIVWIMRWFMRNEQGDDFTFYTLGTEELLTDPQPLAEVYFHGKRPYAMGYAILETHKVMKASVPILLKPLQLESTEIRNQRLDNVKFVLNKRWHVARGRQVDVQSLVRNVPGGVTLMTDPKNDVQESNWADVTSSSYVEHDRLNSEFDDLAGNFSPNTKVANNAVNDTLGGSRMAAQSAGIMTDYMLRTIMETWWEKVLRQLMLLEEAYETDEVILAICAEKAQLFQKFGMSRVTDELLKEHVNLTVNVGFGASDPNAQLARFLAVTKEAVALVTAAPPGFNVTEAIKEMYSKAGYRDGARFFNGQQDPRLAQAMQMVQQLQGMLQGKQMEMQASGQVEAARIQSAERIKAAELRVDAARIEGDLRIRQAEITVEQQRLELEKVKLQVELRGQDQEQAGKLQELALKIEEAQTKLEHERMKVQALAVKTAADLANAERETVATESNEKRISGVADAVTKSMESVAQAIGTIKEDLATTHSGMSAMKDGMAAMGQGLGLVANVMQMPSRKAKGFVLKKNGEKKTQAVLVQYDDGTEDELPVRAA